MKLHATILALALAFVASACTTYSFGHRDTNCDPDERLAQLLDDYEECHRHSDGNGTHLAVDCDRAAVAIERLATEFPRHVPTLQAIAVIAYDNGDRAKAQRYLAAVFAIEPSYPEAAILRSRVAIEEGNLRLAREQLENQVVYTPNHAGVHEALSSVYYLSGEMERASSAITRAEKLGAPAWRVAFNRGLLAEAAGRTTEAQRQYRAALDANPEFTPARARLDGAPAGT